MCRESAKGVRANVRAPYRFLRITWIGVYPTARTTRYIIQIVSKPILVRDGLRRGRYRASIVDTTAHPLCDPCRPQPQRTIVTGRGRDGLRNSTDRAYREPVFSATISGGFNGGSAVKRACPVILGVALTVVLNAVRRTQPNVSRA